ncbi:MAG: hypothetical protein IIA61_03600 [Candidatus Marinimicrobia bacterium]|nr:hypothetical protein [Candidatus Neomarinimicrobiota bacterium]
MPYFNFITDEEFRLGLESDYKELQATFKVEAWKAVHVLAGSIIEALLIDFLLSTKHKSWSTNKILSLKFNEAIKACKEAGLLSNRSEPLTIVVKDFRNLIHPGRIKRLAQNVDRNSAQIAISLVKMIIKEVRDKRQSLYGLTAEQFVTQLERDPNVVKVLEHFTRDMQEAELEKLLLKIIPDSYFELMKEESNPVTDEIIDALQICFHRIFENVSIKVKTKVMQRHIWILKNEGSYKINFYENYFFKNFYFEYIPNGSDRKFIKDRLFALVSYTSGLGDFNHKFDHIGAYLDDDEIVNFSNRVLNCYIKTEEIDKYWIWINYDEMKSDHQRKFIETIDKPRTTFFLSDEAKTKLQDLKNTILSDENDLPF